MDDEICLVHKVQGEAHVVRQLGLAEPNVGFVYGVYVFVVGELVRKQLDHSLVDSINPGQLLKVEEDVGYTFTSELLLGIKGPASHLDASEGSRSPCWLERSQTKEAKCSFPKGQIAQAESQLSKINRSSETGYRKSVKATKYIYSFRRRHPPPPIRRKPLHHNHHNELQRPAPFPGPHQDKVPPPYTAPGPRHPPPHRLTTTIEPTPPPDHFGGESNNFSPETTTQCIVYNNLLNLDAGVTYQTDLKQLCVDVSTEQSGKVNIITGVIMVSIVRLAIS
nr:hypothetical protein HmN_000968700 [Hymenolepis microstoma]